LVPRTLLLFDWLSKCAIRYKTRKNDENMLKYLICLPIMMTT
jgi:hypothetical protein